MNISFKQIELFLVVAKELNFSVAAKNCNLSQPALSVSIKKLEDTIGALLFNRHTRSVTLTATGVEFYRLAEGLQENIKKSHSEIQNFVKGKRGKLIVAASPSIAASLAPKSIQHFLSMHPDVEVILHDETDVKCIEKIKSGKADVALVPIKEVSDEVRRHDLFDDYLVVVYPKNHPLDMLEEISWSDVHQYPLIQIRDSVDLKKTIEKEFMNIGLKIQPAYEVNIAATLLGMIRANIGIGILSRSSLTDTVVAGLGHARMSTSNMYRTIAAVTNAQITPSPLQMPFISSCKVAAAAVYGVE